MISSVLFNFVMTGADAAVLVWFRRSRDLWKLAAGVAGAAFAALFLSFGLGLDMFGVLRLLAWAVFVHAVILLVGIACLLWRSHRKVAISAGAGALLVVGVGIDAFLIEPRWIEVTHVRIATSKLKRPLRIAIIADLQTDEIGGREWKVFQLLSAEKPDLVLYAGDYIQEPDESRRKELFRELTDVLHQAPYSGTRVHIAVEGNCDSPDWTGPLEGSGITCTRETRVFREGEIQVTALSLADSFNSRLSAKGSNLFHIVVGHSPDFALGDVQADLLVAGHTHGGQVRLPFIGPLITLSSVPRAWAAGVTPLEGGRTLVVSRGIGMERGNAPRLRFLCRPELVIIDAVPER